jgi:hypothetical protein
VSTNKESPPMETTFSPLHSFLSGALGANKLRLVVDNAKALRAPAFDQLSMTNTTVSTDNDTLTTTSSGWKWGSLKGRAEAHAQAQAAQDCSEQDVSGQDRSFRLDRVREERAKVSPDRLGGDCQSTQLRARLIHLSK